MPAPAFVSKFSSLPVHFKSAVVLPVVASLAGCAGAIQNPTLPGLDRQTFTGMDDDIIEPIPVSTVMTALKCQLARGFSAIESEKGRDEYKSNPVAAGFIFKDGTGTFSGETKIVETRNGKISAVFPFSGIDGSIITPAFGRGLTSTDTQKISTKFSISPSGANTEICNVQELQDVDVGTFVQDAMLAAFNDTVKVPTSINANGETVLYEPVLRSQEVTIDQSFVVALKVERGITVKALISAPRTDNIDPVGNMNSDRTGTYTLSIKLPLNTGDTSDPRRILSCVHSPNNDRSLCVDDTFTEAKLNDKLENFSAALADYIEAIRRREPPTEEEVQRLAEALEQGGISEDVRSRILESLSRGEGPEFQSFTQGLNLPKAEDGAVDQEETRRRIEEFLAPVPSGPEF